MSPFAAFKARQRVLLGTNMVPIVVIPSIVLVVVDGAGLRQKLQISVFIETAPAATVVMVTAVRVSFCFFCDAHLWCQVERALLQ